MTVRDPSDGWRIQLSAWILALLGILAIPAESSLADPPAKQVAGRTLDGWARDLQSDNPTVKLRAAQTLGAFGPTAKKQLTTLLADQHPAARYLAASHLGDLGADARSAKNELLVLRADKSPGVRMAAAYALARIDPTENNVAVLTAFLEYPERGMACSAAEFLGRIGPPAASALPALEKARKHSDYHLKGASLWAMQTIRGKGE